MKIFQDQAAPPLEGGSVRRVPKRSVRPKLIRRAFGIHRALMWVALVGLSLFVVSALMHPLMVWTGPQSTQFRPPSLSFDQQLAQQQLARGLTLLSELDKRDLQVAKLVPTAQGAMLQVTRSGSGVRQYLSLSESQGSYSDEQQGLWLAQYYSGETRAVASLLRVEEFSTEYPSVNRLLPVYKVVYEGSDNLSVFVHTETNALAGINNDWKRGLQSVFQWLHTWSWLDALPELRVLIIALLMISLLLMSLAGLLLLVVFRRRVYPRKSVGFHRQLAWVVFLPLVALSFSGLYHLLQGALIEDLEPRRLLSTSAASNQAGSEGGVSNGSSLMGVSVQAPNLDVSQVIDSLQGRLINSLSLLHFESKWVLRASIASRRDGSEVERTAGSEHSHRSERNKRFDGRSSERGAQFFSLEGEALSPLNDGLVIESLARQWLGLPAASTQLGERSDQQLALSLVTRFGPDYDFRNKRLPVWRIDANNEAQDRLFIDPVSGLLVDHQLPQSQWERWSFSNLHKWNPLVPFIGREGRDMVVVVILCLIGLTAWFGYRMRSSRR